GQQLAAHGPPSGVAVDKDVLLRWHRDQRVDRAGRRGTCHRSQTYAGRPRSRREAVEKYSQTCGSDLDEGSHVQGSAGGCGQRVSSGTPSHGTIRTCSCWSTCPKAKHQPTSRPVST